jgi:ribose 5-phosphate isomerase
MLSPTEKKRRAAHAAISYVKDGMVLGIGTGSPWASSSKC